ncbi:MAG: Xaa-Pro peptidase family protein [Thermodesulfobacteriota bacterium]
MTQLTPHEEIHGRLDRLRHRLAAADLDGALLSFAVDVFYYSGTRPNGVLWVPAAGEPVLLVRKGLARAREDSPLADIRPFPPSRELMEVLGGSARRIGLPFDVLPVQVFELYRHLLPGCSFADLSAANRELRSVKSAWELEQLRAGGRRQGEIFALLPAIIRPGMRELDVAAELECRLRKAGLAGYLRIRGFNQELTGGLVAAGAGAARPGCFDGPVTGAGVWTAAPYGPSCAVIMPGQPVLVDYGGFWNGYITDMSRLFAIGPLAPDLMRAFQVALAIQDWIAQRLRPGQVPEDLYQGALAMAAEAGLADRFMGPPGEAARFVGHGVGLELDELPVLAPRFREPLRAGQTLAVEPKFLFPGQGVVGIENTFAVSEAGGERLTILDDGLQVL